MMRNSCAWAQHGPWRTLSNNSCARTVIYLPRGVRVQRAPLRISRRYNASQPTVGQKASKSAKTIPGPSWLWLDPIYQPFRAYGRIQQRRPYLTQFVSSLVIYFIGDLIAQSISEANSTAEKLNGETDGETKGWVQEWGNNRDWARTGRALLIGGIGSIPAYRWFLWLGNNFNYKSQMLSLATKVAVNQAFFAPVFNTYFFGMQSSLSGATYPEVIERVKNTVPASCINSCKLWPAVTAFSFTYIPIHFRSIFAGVVATGWQTYLSLLNQKAAAMERMERATKQGLTSIAMVQQNSNIEQEVMPICVGSIPRTRLDGLHIFH